MDLRERTTLYAGEFALWKASLKTAWQRIVMGKVDQSLPVQSPSMLSSPPPSADLRFDSSGAPSITKVSRRHGLADRLVVRYVTPSNGDAVACNQLSGDDRRVRIGQGPVPG